MLCVLCVIWCSVTDRTNHSELQSACKAETQPCMRSPVGAGRISGRDTMLKRTVRSQHRLSHPGVLRCGFSPERRASTLANLFLRQDQKQPGQVILRTPSEAIGSFPADQGTVIVKSIDLIIERVSSQNRTRFGVVQGLALRATAERHCSHLAVITNLKGEACRNFNVTFSVRCMNSGQVVNVDSDICSMSRYARSRTS